jgi:aerobic carbon-monoxide dehydrogenase medium subunit
VEGHPRRIAAAEAALLGRAPGAGVFQAAAEAAALAVDAGTGSPEMAAYQRDVTRAAVRRALEAAEKDA